MSMCMQVIRDDFLGQCRKSQGRGVTKTGRERVPNEGSSNRKRAFSKRFSADFRGGNADFRGGKNGGVCCRAECSGWCVCLNHICEVCGSCMCECTKGKACDFVFYACLYRKPVKCMKVGGNVLGLVESQDQTYAAFFCSFCNLLRRYWEQPYIKAL